MKVLVTGGAGFIGSHTCVQLLENGHEVIVFDNLANSSPKALDRVQEISGRNLTFVEGDLLDKKILQKVFKDHGLDAVIHFAGLKAVGESVEKPLYYYQNNIVGTLNLLHAMSEHNTYKMVFSSSATVYGEAETMPLVEKMPLDATNPYGRTKEQIEDILSDIGAADSRWNLGILRYFNPVGAHPSGKIGEDPQGIPNNLFPYVAQVAVGRREKISVFGGDYPTADGTGVRDYIHVQDLAAGHLAALSYLATNTGVHRWNLGTGRGYSVLEVIKSFEAASQRTIPYEIVARRPGDVATSLADPSAALADLGWSASKGLAEMCADHWRWQVQNPEGYPTN